VPQPQTTTTYVLTAFNAAGASIATSLTVQVLNTFALANDMKVVRAGATATLLPNLKVLIAGGDNGSGSVATAELYDTSTGSFTPTTGPMSIARAQHTATLLTTGKVLIVGGVTAGGNKLKVELYDPVTDTFSQPFSLPTGEERLGHTATLLPNGKILIAGGNDSTPTALRSADLIDVGAGSATLIGATALAVGRFQHTAILLNAGTQSGKVLIAGGNSSVNSTNEFYDPAANTFSVNVNEMKAPRSRHTATLLNSGKVLFVGGNTGVAAVQTAEIFDPGSLIFNSTTGAPLKARQFHTATLLNSGNVLIEGGVAGTAGSAEIYRFNTDNFVATGNLNTARTLQHTATMLMNGFLLVAGGTGATVNSAELFNPE
jgi:hypothetical protein